MAHLGARAFEDIGGEVVQTTSFIFENNHIKEYQSIFKRLVDYNSQDGKEEEYLADRNLYVSSSENFNKIPGNPIAYWASSNVLDVFKNGIALEKIADCCTGMQTGNNEKYVRNWFEISTCDFNSKDVSFGAKWIKYNCGGESRKWYGNHWRVINWENNGYAVKHEKGSVIRNEAHFFQEGISWKRIGSSDFFLRYLPEGFIIDQAGDSMFLHDNSNLYYVLALVNTNVALSMFKFIAPTLNLTAGNMNKLPIIFNNGEVVKIEKNAKKNIEREKEDWDSFETSWDFAVHPLVKNHVSTISEAYLLWDKECNDRFNQLKTNEEELNRIFIDIYGLQDELDPYVEDKDVTVRKADVVRDIKSFISYAVGCMFGRYSLDKEGLVFAGGSFDDIYWKYRGEAPLNLDGSLPSGDAYAGVSLAKLHYAAIRDNDDYIKATKLKYEPDIDDIIPICDEDYFEDDIVTRFVEFVRCVYGEDTLEENLRFIADALGGKGNPREVLRNYFLNDFFKDHCNTYQVTGSGKRPIYWLFDSGKKNGFKALVYIHRYAPDLIARMRTGYIHPQQARYRTQVELLQSQIDEASSTSEKVKLSKQLKKINEQLLELNKYEEVVHHWADKMESMDLDDGVKANYAKFQELLAKIK